MNMKYMFNPNLTQRSLQITYIFSIKVMGGVGASDLFRMDFTRLEQPLYLSFSS